jgi:N,N'-diacetyllegionaminate synthase
MPKTLIIAEAGVNHNGDLDLAYKLIDAAKSSGADIVKFQTFNTNKLVSKHAQKAEYQRLATAADESQFEMIKKLEFDLHSHILLKSYCEKKKIEFLSAPFDVDSIKLLHKLGVSRFKIPSGEITNFPYLREMAAYDKPIIMSTGMSNMVEIQQALNVLADHGSQRKNIILLHCNTEYPTPFEDVNLSAMITMQQAFMLPVGYSDHTNGIEVPIAAVALGASVIEKHFTLDRNMPGPDHSASLEPTELRALVSAIRNIEAAIGDGIKAPRQSESKNITIVRKCIIASKPIRQGDIFSEENITTKRAGLGLSPMRWMEVLGGIATRNYDVDDKIEI